MIKRFLRRLLCTPARAVQDERDAICAMLDRRISDIADMIGAARKAGFLEDSKLSKHILRELMQVRGEITDRSKAPS